MRDQFIDPRVSDGTYVWPRNHSDEDAGERTRGLTEQQPSRAPWAYVPPIRQQGKSGTLVMRLTGRITDPLQHEAFRAFQRLCQSQTIHFRHCDGGLYEVVLSKYEPTRIGVVRTREGLPQVWSYTMELEVVSQLEE